MKLLRVGAIVSIAWFAAAALTPLTSVAIRNSAMTTTAITASTLDSTPIGNSSASSVRSTYLASFAPAPNPALINTSMVGWNASLGNGETDFVNDYGTAPGGFDWYATGTSSSHSWGSSPLMILSKTGGLAVASTILSGSTITAPLFSGPLSGNVTGNLSGTVTGSLNGNASTASAFNHTPAACGTMQAMVGISSTGAPTCVPIVQSGSGPGGVTSSGSFSTTSSIVTLSPGYGDSGYQAVCTLTGPSDPRASIWGTVKTATAITVLVTTNGSAAISYAGVDCMAKHN
jgi:hypothetical protein